MHSDVHSGGPLRNVTAEFIRLRTEHKRKKNRFGSPILGIDEGRRRREGESPFLGDGRMESPGSSGQGDRQVNIEMFPLQRQTTSLPPLWADLVEECKDDICRIKERLSVLQKSQQRRMLRIFGEEGQLHNPDKDVEKISNELSNLLREAESRIKRIQPGDLCFDESENKVRQNAKLSLATQLQTLSQHFRKQQKTYLQELKNRSAVSGHEDLVCFDPLSVKTPQEVQPDSLLFDTSPDSLLQDLETMERDVHSRNEEIASIARSVGDLHSIFQELAVMVIDQGTVLDRIDFNIEKVVDETSRANIHIRKAEEYQRNSRVTRVMIFLVVGIILLLLMLVWKHV